jgi:hypothetical protein
VGRSVHFTSTGDQALPQLDADPLLEEWAGVGADRGGGQGKLGRRVADAEVEEEEEALGRQEAPPRAAREACRFLAPAALPSYHGGMSTLADVEKAADALSQEEKERLILFLAARLRGEGVRTPPPRTLSREQVDAWIAEDEAELRAFKREG